MYKLEEISEIDNDEVNLEKAMKEYNFEVVYKEYYAFASLGNIAQKKSVAMKGFQNLVSYSMISRTDSATKCPKEFQMFKTFPASFPFLSFHTVDSK